MFLWKMVGFFFILYYIFCMSAEFFFSIFDTVLFNCCKVFCRSKISDLASLGSSIVLQIVYVICLYTLSSMSISLNRKHFSVIQRVLDLSELDFIFHFYQSFISIEFIYFVESEVSSYRKHFQMFYIYRIQIIYIMIRTYQIYLTKHLRKFS